MQIISGKTFKPYAIILGGVPGVGKTTWAAQSEKPLFICGDEVSEFDVDRLPQVKSWKQFKEQLKWVLDTKPNNKTLVIDTIDAMEKMLHTEIIESDPKKKKSMNEVHGGFGNGLEIAATEMLEVRDQYIKRIRDELGMNIIIIVHSQNKKKTDVVHGMEYDTLEMCLHKKIIPVWYDWVSGVFFADHVTYKVEGDNTKKVFLKSKGERVLFTTQNAAHFGKNRWNLPEELSLDDFNDFYSRYKAFYEKGPSAEDIIIAIHAATKGIKEAGTAEKVLKQAEESKTNIPKLQRILTRVQELTGA